MLFNLLCMYTKSFMILQAPKATKADRMLFLAKKRNLYVYRFLFYHVIQILD